MVNALFTALALIAAGQVEPPSSSSSASDVRNERLRGVSHQVNRLRRLRERELGRDG